MKKDLRIKKTPEGVKNSFNEFWEEVKTIECEKELDPILFQDNKSGAFYIECHSLASVVESLLDTDAVLDPEEQEEFRANRDIQERHKAFLKMIADAQSGRQFSDIIIEFNKQYKADKPLKVLGGQHRVFALRESLANGVDRPHGFKVYFDLTMEQRNEITQISNTNIAIPADLIDRMQETMLRSGLREWCKKVGILKKNEDFSERKTTEGIISVRVARSFVVNFIEGMKEKFDPKKLYIPYICKSGVGGEIDARYKKLLDDRKDKLWQDKNLLSAGKAFSNLHKTQMKAIDSDPDLMKIKEYRIKAITPVVASAWALIAGLIAKDVKRQTKFYNLSSVKNENPLNSEGLSNANHHTDESTYRGVGTRTDKKELGRMAEILLTYIDSPRSNITKNIIDAGIRSYHAKVAMEEAETAKDKI